MTGSSSSIVDVVVASLLLAEINKTTSGKRLFSFFFHFFLLPFCYETRKAEMIVEVESGNKVSFHSFFFVDKHILLK